MNYLKSQIELTNSNCNEQIVCYITGSHAGFLTYDGIDVNGKRICDEILSETSKLNVEKDKVVKFSMIGYSLGGLISRYAIGYLYSKEYFNDIEAVNFTTFCTPHVGGLNPGQGWGNKLFNFCVPYILAHTGSQLFLADGKKDKLPLLVWMSDSQSAFGKALENFKHRNLYANIINDKRTSYFTSAISAQDPFKSMVNENSSAYSLEYIKGYEPTVIDITKPIQFVLNENVSTPLERGKDSIHRKLNWLKVFGQAIIITPIWFFWMLGNSILEIIKNRKRVFDFLRANDINYLHDHDESILDSLEYDIENNFKDSTDTFVESVFDAMNSDSYKDYHRGRTGNTSINLESLSEVDNMTDSKDSLSLVNLRGKVQGFQLDLNNYQKLIINNLNSLQWNKFPILIRNTKQTHRAAIVRHDDPQFEEGTTVVRHFVNEVFEF